ncbi:hypothetical protein QQS21_006601 [Conoideocrella luteorostrata]|uniref:cyclic pyranopterin monophosphate synthase n=1 Tax=Conoideocrella luteorostrata TaxID=1105319 RepID=A0AAJ0CMA8_9HYPO|nr:hypothetical protein QQS21_006601 [Conoideocrella luteorostrata]
MFAFAFILKTPVVRRLLSGETVDPLPASLSSLIPGPARQLIRSMGVSGLSQISEVGRWSDQKRLFSTSSRHGKNKSNVDGQISARLTHVSDTGSARMVSISEKSVTSRTATAACRVRFSNNTAVSLIQDNQMRKGDVLGVARVAGIMAAKRTPDLIPLCHPIAISCVTIDLEPDTESHSIEIRATVICDGKTGVEMEAMTAASTAALTVYDMCKAVDKAMVVECLRVVLKDGGKSGRWEID